MSKNHIDNKDLVFELMRRIAPRPLTSRVIKLAYDSGYEPKSDGITLGGQFEFKGFKLKNPCGVGHDWLYFMGIKNPVINASGDERLEKPLGKHPAKHESTPWAYVKTLTEERGAVKLIMTETDYRRWADGWFRGAMLDFGYWAFAGLYWLALRIFALRAWQYHRARNHPCPIDQLPDVR